MRKVNHHAQGVHLPDRRSAEVSEAPVWPAEGLAIGSIHVVEDAGLLLCSVFRRLTVGEIAHAHPQAIQVAEHLHASHAAGQALKLGYQADAARCLRTVHVAGTQREAQLIRMRRNHCVNGVDELERPDQVRAAAVREHGGDAAFAKAGQIHVELGHGHREVGGQAAIETAADAVIVRVDDCG